MAIYYCPMCNKKFFIDNIDDADEVITCSMCGSTINLKKLEKEYEQKRQASALEEIDAPQPSEDTYKNATASTGSQPENVSLTIQKRQLEELESIKNMLKFFTILTVISLVISFILALIALS